MADRYARSGVHIIYQVHLLGVRAERRRTTDGDPRWPLGKVLPPRDSGARRKPGMREHRQWSRNGTAAPNGMKGHVPDVGADRMKRPTPRGVSPNDRCDPSRDRKVGRSRQMSSEQKEAYVLDSAQSDIKASPEPSGTDRKR
jgi:hypothetical protein